MTLKGFKLKDEKRPIPSGLVVVGEKYFEYLQRQFDILFEIQMKVLEYSTSVSDEDKAQIAGYAPALRTDLDKIIQAINNNQLVVEKDFNIYYSGMGNTDDTDA